MLCCQDCNQEKPLITINDLQNDASNASGGLHQNNVVQVNYDAAFGGTALFLGAAVCCLPLAVVGYVALNQDVVAPNPETQDGTL